MGKTWIYPLTQEYLPGLLYFLEGILIYKPLHATVPVWGVRSKANEKPMISPRTKRWKISVHTAEFNHFKFLSIAESSGCGCFFALRTLFPLANLLAHRGRKAKLHLLFHDVGCLIPNGSTWSTHMIDTYFVYSYICSPYQHIYIYINTYTHIKDSWQQRGASKSHNKIMNAFHCCPNITWLDIVFFLLLLSTALTPLLDVPAKRSVLLQPPWANKAVQYLKRTRR